MSTSIQWTNETWNPVRGCSRVSAGCDNCYAIRKAARFSGPGMPYEGLIRFAGGRLGGVDWSGSARLVPEMLAQPLKWKKPRRIFVNSMSDLFHPSLTNEEIAAVFGVMAACPQHTFQVLTKRPKRMLEWFKWVVPHEWHVLQDCEEALTRNGLDLFQRAKAMRNYPLLEKWRWPLPNVHLGVSVEDQKTADERIPLLLQCPAAVRWVSAEPLIGPVDLSRFFPHEFQPGSPEYGHERQCSVTAPDNMRHCGYPPETHPMPGIDWVVVGGESGPGARPCDVEWIRSIVRQCKAASVPCFTKQLGSRPVLDGAHLSLSSKKGSDPEEWPIDIQVRESP